MEVQDYILNYIHKNILYEIHLIDSPGFDDGSLLDSQVLSRIATYLNTNYKCKQRLAGVLYLHDITKAKVGGVGERNLRMLENMIGSGKYKIVHLSRPNGAARQIRRRKRSEKRRLRRRKISSAGC